MLMRKNTILLLFLFLGLSLSAFPDNPKVSLKIQDKNMKTALQQIEKGSDWVFFYSEKVNAMLDKKVNIDINSESIETVLNKLLETTNLTYEIKGNQISILMKETQPVSTKSIELSGVVISGTDNEPVIGVSVFIEGTGIGTSTDANGEYTLTVPATTQEVTFSYLGYVTQKIAVKDRNLFRLVTLYEDSQSLDEVTIVAFGKQKKESVIGSITSVNVKDLKVPSSNLTTAFAGQMAGMIAYQRSGEPGADNADFFVRGITTFGTNRNPLILIDNIELTSTDLARLQPDDIASFSIMKDATATALYGARGANGVILITTKQGSEGSARVSFRMEKSLSTPTRKVQLADPVTWMKLANEAVLTRDPLGSVPFTEEKIDNTINGTDPLRYPAVDWMNMLIRDYAISDRYNLNVSGGGSNHRYYVAGSFNHDNGILKVDKRNNFNNNINNKSYSLRSNIELTLTKTTKMNVRLSGTFDDYSGPLTGGTDMFNNIINSNTVLFPAYYPPTSKTAAVKHIMFGNKDNQYYNPYAELMRGYKERDRSQLLAQVEADQKLDFITQGLSVRGMLNISRLSQFAVNRFYTPSWYELVDKDEETGEYNLHNTNTGTDWLDYNEGERGEKITNSTFYTELMTNYNRTFGDHGVSGLLVAIARQSLDAQTGSLQMSLPYRNLGLSGRFTYSFTNRYFLEFNFGYNGSERFHKSHQFGFFPSAGLAWNVSNESFWEPVKNTVNNLKLRYSYGLVGNDQIGSATDRFYYLSEMNMYDYGRGFTFGNRLGERQNGISILREANPNLGWEISYKSNYAIELGLWKDLTIIAEYFHEKRTNILMDRSYIPQTMGLTYTAKANVGEASGRGTDISLEYQKSWTKDFWTSARANFTYATSKFEIYDEPAYEEAWRSRVGKPLSQTWGYIAERLFVDDAETLSSPRQEMTTYKYGGGDIKYTDVNRDGKITGADMVPIGLPTTPEIVYGFGLSTGYKGIDFSIFFQGLTNESFWISTYDDRDKGVISTVPFQNNTQLLQAYADSHWSEDNGNIYAIWPRLSYTINSNNILPSTWFMRDGTFLRLKQAEIGYTIPGNWQKKLHIGNLRFYLSGTNLLLWSRFKLWDVEMAGNGTGYPIQRVINLGLNLTFN
ncbi:SusC/RagA family TonB-linked outer membrane protein [Bacteroidia bacterium]|nr:SusC/RagA family TonB-linked outer membrane protein [Bacteroidia bacterium]